MSKRLLILFAVLQLVIVVLALLSQFTLAAAVSPVATLAGFVAIYVRMGETMIDTLFGFPVIVDPDMPNDEIIFDALTQRVKLKIDQRGDDLFVMSVDYEDKPA